jgi:predicted DNA-binding protein (UPF0251 family)
MSKGGRPSVELTDSQIIELEALSSVLNQDQIADYFGISRTTFHELRKRDERVSEHYKKGKAKAIAGIGSNLISQAKSGNTTAAIFYLKTQAGWKETPTEAQDLPPVVIQLTRDEADSTTE